MPWKITFDTAKREWTLRERKLDFLDASRVFDDETYDIPDTRHDYGEFRINSVGHLNGRMLIICWTQRGDARHIISMRKTNGREKRRYRKALAAYNQRPEEG